MGARQDKISCCKGRYRIQLDQKFYCMRPPGIECDQTVVDVGKFTKGKKKILYCQHFQDSCEHCEKYKEEG